MRLPDIPGTWRPWFAWYPVRLLTMQWVWLRTVSYRKPAQGGRWAFFGCDYAARHDGP